MWVHFSKSRECEEAKENRKIHKKGQGQQSIEKIIKAKKNQQSCFWWKKIKILLENCEGCQCDLVRVIKWMRKYFARN